MERRSSEVGIRALVAVFKCMHTIWYFVDSRGKKLSIAP